MVDSLVFLILAELAVPVFFLVEMVELEARLLLLQDREPILFLIHTAAVKVALAERPRQIRVEAAEVVVAVATLLVDLPQALLKL